MRFDRSPWLRFLHRFTSFNTIEIDLFVRLINSCLQDRFSLCQKSYIFIDIFSYIIYNSREEIERNTSKLLMRCIMYKKGLAALLALVMVLASFPYFALATTEAEKPADSTTQGQPFVSGDPSQYYRIPCLVTLNDGTLVAAADARWDAQMDGGGNDTIASYSTDNGATWNYTMVNYYGDNGNEFNLNSTGFCDSELATDGENLYMLSLFFPAGVALNSSSANNRPVAADAFDSSDRLLLGQGSSTSYDYYLGAFGSDGFAHIYSSSGSVVSEYTVDREFYLYKNGVKEGSVFYDDAAYQTVKTSFLFFRTSSDKGASWSAPSLVPMQRADECFLGVGPGRGLVIDNPNGSGGKRLMFSCYHWENKTNPNNYQKSCFIYSDDGGATWTRSSDATTESGNIFGTASWSSENQLVELNDGTIRMVYRNGEDQICYVDYTWNGSTYVKGSNVHTGQSNRSDCQVSAIKYPYTIKGKQAMLVACPSDTSARKSGRLYCFLLNDDNSVSEVITGNLTSSNQEYHYSCLTVLNNGRLGILYEGTNSQPVFTTRDVASLLNVKVDKPDEINVKLSPGGTTTYNINSTGAEIKSSDETVATVSTAPLAQATATKGNSAAYDGAETDLSEALFTFSQNSDGSYVISNSTTLNTDCYLNIVNGSDSGYPCASSSQNITVQKQSSGAYKLAATGSNTPALYFWHDGKNYYDRYNLSDAAEVDEQTNFYLYRPVKSGESSSTELPGYVQATDIENNAQYLIAHVYNDTYFFLYPSLSTSNKYSHCVKGTGADSVMTLTAVNPGTAQITVGDSAIYYITVADTSSTVEVTGAVLYDPVIYTHGSASDASQNYMMYGNLIADGSSAGEKSTAYTVTDSRYTIQSIECEEYGGTITPGENGVLTGTLEADISAGYAYDTLKPITLRTVLKAEGDDVTEYVQENSLYVTSNPVAAHAIAAMQTYKSAIGGSYVTVMPLLVTANGSIGDVNATTTSGYRQNAKNLYTANAMTYQKDGGFLQLVTDGVDKITGRGEHSSQGGSGNREYTVSITDDSILGYYYYDMSSDSNAGITRVSGTNGQQFTLNMGVTPILTTGSRTNTHSLVTFAESGNGISGNGFTAAQQAFSSYTIGDSATTQTLPITGDATQASNGIMTGSIRAVARTQRDDDSTVVAHTDVRVPFQVNICDKSDARTPYNDAMFKMRVQTDYTTDTWNAYKKALDAAEPYLNDYTNLDSTKAEALGTALDTAYNELTKRAQFTDLEAALEMKQEQYGQFATESERVKYAADSWIGFVEAYEDGGVIIDTYVTDTVRANTAGYTSGPDSETKTLQSRIDSDTENILKDLDLQPVADDESFVAAKQLSSAIDLSAYQDEGASVEAAINSGNSTIYKEYNGVSYINTSSQSVVDACTTALMTSMNVGAEDSMGRTFHVDYTVNGSAQSTVENKTDYVYGSVAHIDLSSYNSDQYTVKCTVNSANSSKTPTTVNLVNNNYYLSVLIQEDMIITVEVFEKPSITVLDYYGTVIGAFTGSSVTVSGNTITVGSDSVIAKPSPKYLFTGWSKADGTYAVSEPLTIRQVGTPVPGAVTVSTVGGTVNGAERFEADAVNTKLELGSEDAKYWTRTVDGKEYLASYEANFVNFSALEDVTYTAYASADQLPAALQEQINGSVPATYGTGFFANDKFTLSCDYSAPEDAIILEVGVIYSTTANTASTLVKGGENAKAFTTNNVAHWSSADRSGTYTMTKTGSASGTHFMRSYVSYTLKSGDYTIPYIAYGDTIYQCVDGTVSQVTD